MSFDACSLAGARVVITGAAGFIGSHMAEAAVASSAEVIGVDRFGPDGRAGNPNIVRLLECDGFRLLTGDVRDPEAMAQVTAGADYLVHLAAVPGVRGSGTHYWAVNHDGTRVAVSAAVKSGVRRVVLASSSSVYRPSGGPLGESSAQEPRSDYARSKAGAERIALEICDGRSELVILRYFTVYGPRQRPDMLCSRLIRSALDGVPMVIFGEGLQTRPFTYVSDVIAGSIAALVSGRAAGAYNLAGPRSVSVREVIELVGERVGGPPAIIKAERWEQEHVRVAADTSKARRDLGYSPRVGIREGVSRQFDALAEQRASLHPRPTALVPDGRGDLR